MEDSLAERVVRVRAKAQARGVRLDPPWAARDLDAFEARAAVTLPGAYRAFLLDIGDGPNARVDREIVYGDRVAAPAESGASFVFRRGLKFTHGRDGWYQVRPEHEKERKRREGPPLYGLCPLERTLADDIGRPLRPSAPFPLRTAWIWEDEGERDGTRIQAVRSDGPLYRGTGGRAI